MRQNAQAEHRNRMATAQMLNQRQEAYDNIPEDDKRRIKMHHSGHNAPRNYDEAASDLFAYTSSITLPDTAMANHDRIKECIHRNHSRIEQIIHSMRDGQMDEQEAHQHVHGLAQNIMDELDLPHRESVNLMPYTISNID